jgi:hypothetical protein
MQAVGLFVKSQCPQSRSQPGRHEKKDATSAESRPLDEHDDHCYCTCCAHAADN